MLRLQLMRPFLPTRFPRTAEEYARTANPGRQQRWIHFRDRREENIAYRNALILRRTGVVRPSEGEPGNHVGSEADNRVARIRPGTCVRKIGGP